MKNAKEKAAPAIVWEKIASCLWEGRMGGRTEFVIKLCGAAYRMCRPDFPETLTSYSSISAAKRGAERGKANSMRCAIVWNYHII